MPALLAHDFFAQDAFGSAIQTVSLYTPDERDAFLLGSQGPDPLFYLLLPPLEEFRKLGNLMHSEGPSSLLVAMRMAVDGLDEEDQPIGRAYLAGFVCHYLLDRAIHPLVGFWERGICQAGVLDLDATDSSAVHAEVERDFDEMVLYKKRNQTILAYRPYEEVLRARDEVLDILTMEIMELNLDVKAVTDEDFAQNAFELEKISSKALAYDKLLKANPGYRQRLMTRRPGARLSDLEMVEKRLNQMLAVSDYYRARRALITDPYYILHYNEELSADADKVRGDEDRLRIAELINLVARCSRRMQGSEYRTREDSGIEGVLS